MPDIFDIIRKWWKQMTLVIFLSVVAVGLIVFMKPKQFLSVATSVPASSYAADRSRLFNENIQALYSTLGTADDLDLILGTAQLDTVYLSVTDLFNLYDHYKISEKGDAARKKAAAELKGNSAVMKSGYGELKVKVWDTDKYLAPQLANAIMDRLDEIHKGLQGEINKYSLQSIRAQQDTLAAQIRQLEQQTVHNETYTSKMEVLTSQHAKFMKMIMEYELLIATRPPVLLPVEKASVAAWPDKPKIIKTLIATFILAALFSFLVGFFLAKRETHAA